jgi:hypothetical protein
LLGADDRGKDKWFDRHCNHNAVYEDNLEVGKKGVDDKWVSFWFLEVNRIAAIGQ